MTIPPKLTQAAASKAVSLAQTALQNENVRKQLKEAPDQIARWAKAQKAALQGSSTGKSLLDPLTRFGQQGLERRLEAIEANVEIAFPEETDDSRIATLRAALELRKALIVSSSLPLVARKKVHLRIDGEVSQLEQALVDAILPPAAPT